MSVRKKIIVAFNLEMTEQFEGSHEDESEILDEIATYLANWLDEKEQNSLAEGYRLADPAVWWPEGFMEDVAEGSFKEEWEGGERTCS